MAIDGGLGSKTALMHEPFRDFTRSTVPVRLDLNKLGSYIREANDLGWGVGIHCCGDLAQDIAVSHMVDAFKVRRPLPHQRHHIVHAYFPTEYSLRAMSANDIAVSTQPGFIYVEGDAYPAAVDESRLADFKPLRTYLDRGIRVAINSDVSSGPYDPFVVLYGAVARKTIRGLDFGRREALSAREAVDCFCSGGAYLAYRETECGRLEPGKMADLAILDRDILEGPPGDILKTKVEATMLGGRFVYRREGGAFSPGRA
jgi:predicted amidohydrolase YtcJ